MKWLSRLRNATGLNILPAPVRKLIVAVIRIHHPFDWPGDDRSAGTRLYSDFHWARSFGHGIRVGAPNNPSDAGYDRQGPRP